MEENTFKVGQEIEITGDFVMETNNGNVFNIKKGDKATLDCEGIIHYTCGEGKGTCQEVECKVEGYYIEGITDFIINNIDEKYNLLNILKEKNINIDEFIEDININLATLLY